MGVDYERITSQQHGWWFKELNYSSLLVCFPPANFPPNVTLIDAINVTVGETFTIQIEAFDPDGDDIMYGLLDDTVANASISAEGQ